MNTPYSMSEILKKSVKKPNLVIAESMVEINRALTKDFISTHEIVAPKPNREDSGVFTNTIGQSHQKSNSFNKMNHLNTKPRVLNENFNNIYANPNVTSLQYLMRENSENYSREYSQSSYENANEIFLNIRTDVYSLRKSLGHILKEIVFITTRLKENEEFESKELCWKFAAQVEFNRSLLISYLLFILLYISLFLFFSTLSTHFLIIFLLSFIILLN
jgi:hypothetical protein